MRMLIEGRVLPAVTAPAAVLTTPATTTDPCDPATVRLVADMVATMRAAPACIGLAAPQVGVGVRVICLDVTGHPAARSCAGLLTLVNPRILRASRWQKGREGCLSVPSARADVKRATRVVVSGRLPETGEEVIVDADAMEARTIQHEVDHLDGTLILDRAAGPHAIHPRQIGQIGQVNKTSHIDSNTISLKTF